MNVLVTGGAGYIGSIGTEHLLKQGHSVTVLDNRQQEHKEAVLSPAEFILGDVGDAETLERIFRRSRIDDAMHMAADRLVGHSMTDPKRYFHNNLVGGISLLNSMLNDPASEGQLNTLHPEDSFFTLDAATYCSATTSQHPKAAQLSR